MNNVKQWLALALLILQYGRDIVTIAIEIYHKVEEAFKDDKSVRPEKKSSLKAQTFDVMLKKNLQNRKGLNSRYKFKALNAIPQIREKIHQIESSKKRSD